MAEIKGDDGPNALSDFGGGNDSLYGLSGNDQLSISYGRDYANGGFDEDKLVVNWSDATGAIYLGTGYAFVNTGAGEASYATSKRAVGFEHMEHIEFNAGSGDDYLNGIAGAVDILDGGGGVDIWSDSFASFTGDLKINMSDGGGGLADGSAISNMEAAQFLDLGEGNDSFRDYGRFGGAFDDNVYGRGGNDRMETSCGQDYFGGGAGTDTLVVNWVNRREGSYLTAPGGYGFAYTSADAYYGNSLRKIGFDAFEILDFTGGLGDDTVIGFANTADRINGYTGVDRWEDDMSAFTGDLKVDLTAQGPDRPLADGSVYWNLESVSLMLGSGDDSFRDYGFKVATGGFDDVIRSNAGDDDLGTSYGRDEFYAGDGVDTLRINWQSASRAIVVDAPFGYSYVKTAGATDYATSTRRVHAEGFEHLDVRGSTENDTFRGFGNAADSFDGGNGNDLWIDDFSEFKRALNVDMGECADGFAGLKLADGTRLLQIDRADIVLGSGNDRFRDKRNLDDRVEGRKGNDSFATSGGKDVMHGGEGSDTLAIDWSNAFAKCAINGLTGQAFAAVGGNSFETSDRRVEFSGIEHLDVKGGARSDLFVGTAGSDVFDGSNGSDVIDYGARTESVAVTLKFAGLVDVKIGGKVEDRIQDVEYVIGGSGNDRLTGDLSDNALTGNGGADTLDGGSGGNDLLTGGAGDDLFVIGNVGDKAVEREGEGVDTVRSAVSYSLDGQAIEKLVLVGAALDGFGNELANTLTGNGRGNRLFGLGGNDALSGGAGFDTLAGGGGKDRFAFETSLALAGVDTIRDFSAADDTITLDNAFFAGLSAGRLSSGRFKNTAAGTVDASDRILYDAKTGSLSFDRDGSGTGFSAVQFADLEPQRGAHPALTAADFLVV